jgi:hypothetical protein
MDVTWMDDCCNIVALDRLRTVLAGTCSHRAKTATKRDPSKPRSSAR